MTVLSGYGFPMATTRTAPHRAAVPDIAPYRPQFRTVGTEVQRSTLGGGWEAMAVAENPDWAGTIAAALNWLHNPQVSEAG